MSLVCRAHRAFHQRVVVGVADRADGGVDADLEQVRGEGERGVPAPSGVLHRAARRRLTRSPEQRRQLRNPTAAEALNSLFSASILHSTRGDSAMEVDVVQLPLNVGASEAINP